MIYITVSLKKLPLYFFIRQQRQSSTYFRCNIPFSVGKRSCPVGWVWYSMLHIEGHIASVLLTSSHGLPTKVKLQKPWRKNYLVVKEQQPDTIAAFIYKYYFTNWMHCFNCPLVDYLWHVSNHFPWYFMTRKCRWLPQHGDVASWDLQRSHDAF